ncbi:MAG: 2-phosphosulfolactate phosphatase [Candidatus Helarchaeota archaeon]
MKLKISTTLGISEVNKFDIKEYIVVLIDVLRASSTITTLFEQGVLLVYSVKEKKDAIKLKSKFKNYILIGERYGIKIKNFDYGNSPYEIYKHNYKGKKVIFTSSNFSRVLDTYKNAPIIIVGCILNAKSVSEYIKSIVSEKIHKVLLVQIGTAEQPSYEDQLGCKIIYHYLNSQEINFNNEKIHDILIKTPNGKYLTQIGYEKDIEFCSKLNKFKIIPIKKGKDYFEFTHLTK